MTGEGDRPTTAGDGRLPGPPPRVEPTAGWLAEQRRKQEAYAASRRAWARALDRAAAGLEVEDAPDQRQPPPAAGPAPAPGEGTGPAARRPSASRGGTIHDPG